MGRFLAGVVVGAAVAKSKRVSDTVGKNAVIVKEAARLAAVQAQEGARDAVQRGAVASSTHADRLADVITTKVEQGREKVKGAAETTQAKAQDIKGISAPDPDSETTRVAQEKLDKVVGVTRSTAKATVDKTRAWVSEVRSEPTPEPEEVVVVQEPIPAELYEFPLDSSDLGETASGDPAIYGTEKNSYPAKDSSF